jgi:hypothetical protein
VGLDDDRSLDGHGKAVYRGVGYSDIALTMIAANANPATAPAAMAAVNSNMNSPIVNYPTACRAPRSGRSVL